MPFSILMTHPYIHIACAFRKTKQCAKHYKADRNTALNNTTQVESICDDVYLHVHVHNLGSKYTCTCTNTGGYWLHKHALVYSLCSKQDRTNGYLCEKAKMEIRKII